LDPESVALSIKLRGRYVFSLPNLFSRSIYQLRLLSKEADSFVKIIIEMDETSPPCANYVTKSIESR